MKSRDQVAPYTDAANRALLDMREAAFTFKLTNPAGGFGGVGLKPWDERERSVFEILPEAQARLQRIPGIQMLAVIPPALPGGGQFPVEFVIASTAETTEILGFAQKLQQQAAETGMFAFPPQIDVKIDQSQAELVLDRDKVAALGLSMQEIGGDVAAAVGGDYVNRFSIAGRSYKVIPQLKREQRLNPEQIRELYVAGPGAGVIPLSTVATLERSVQPRSLNRFQQLNAVKISGVATRSLDDALSYLERRAEASLPKGYVVDYTGESRQLRTEGNTFLPAFGLAVVLIWHSKLGAARESARTRLRPILMTTVATICGHFPLTLVSGPGASARNSIGLVLVTGMAIGTLFTLFLVPSLYVLIARDQTKERLAREPAISIPPGPEPAPA